MVRARGPLLPDQVHRPARRRRLGVRHDRAGRHGLSQPPPLHPAPAAASGSSSSWTTAPATRRRPRGVELAPEAGGTRITMVLTFPDRDSYDAARRLRRRGAGPDHAGQAGGDRRGGRAQSAGGPGGAASVRRRRDLVASVPAPGLRRRSRSTCAGAVVDHPGRRLRRLGRDGDQQRPTARTGTDQAKTTTASIPSKRRRGGGVSAFDIGSAVLTSALLPGPVEAGPMQG